MLRNIEILTRLFEMTSFSSNFNTDLLVTMTSSNSRNFSQIIVNESDCIPFYFISSHSISFYSPFYSDILDDDSPVFLDALKRQMDGADILNASPREVRKEKYAKEKL